MIRFAVVKRLPEPLCSPLGGIQGGLGEFAIVGDKAAQFLTPDLRMEDIGVGMESEISAGMRIGAIMTHQRTRFFAADARHLGLIGIECGEDFGWRSRGWRCGKSIE